MIENKDVWEIDMTHEHFIRWVKKHYPDFQARRDIFEAVAREEDYPDDFLNLLHYQTFRAFCAITELNMIITKNKALNIEKIIVSLDFREKELSRVILLDDKNKEVTTATYHDDVYHFGENAEREYEKAEGGYVFATYYFHFLKSCLNFLSPNNQETLVFSFDKNAFKLSQSNTLDDLYKTISIHKKSEQFDHSDDLNLKTLAP